MHELPSQRPSTSDMLRHSWRCRTATERVRLLVYVVAVVAAAVQAPNAASAGVGRAPGYIALAAGASLLYLWTRALRRSEFPAWTLPLELAAVLGYGLGMEQPAAALGAVFAAALLRSLYSAGKVATAALAGYIVNVVALAAALGSSDRIQRPGDLALLVGPGLVVTVAVGRVLAVCLARHESNRALSRRLADAAHRLATARRPDQVWRVVQTAAGRLAPAATRVRAVPAGDAGPAPEAGEHSVLLDLSHGDGSHGWLRITSARPFSAEQREALSTLSIQAAAALDNLALRARLAEPGYAVA